MTDVLLPRTDASAGSHAGDAVWGLRAEIDRAAAEDAIRCLLRALRQDPDNEDLRDTPRRVADAYVELLTPQPFLLTTFENPDRYEEVVIAKEVPFQSLCEHHLMPFSGVVHVGYQPGERIVGLSKLARAVDSFGRALQVQERLTTQIADALFTQLGARAVGVVVEAEHNCMSTRGIRAQGARTITTAFRGTFQTDSAARREFMDLVRS